MVADDWGGWLVQSTLLQPLSLLVDELKHTSPTAWPSIGRRFLVTADPLAGAVAVALLVAALCFLLSLPTNNHSFVDKIWSIVPVYYAWHFALHDRLVQPDTPVNPRLAIMAALITAWGIRLTYNFARKGGYRWSAEDYRWPWLRSKISAPLFFLFNLAFISLYQNLLLLSLTAPAYLAWQNKGTPLNGLDVLAAVLCAFFIVFETVADQQQWEFQNAKHAKLAARKRLNAEESQGFCSSGLFRYSRHPNFWAEQSLWCSMYLFGVAASGCWLNWTIAAPIQLILLFQGSTWLTEKLSAAKYPKYAQYQATTSCFIPWFPLSATQKRRHAGIVLPTKATRRQLAAKAMRKQTAQAAAAAADAIAAAPVAEPAEDVEEVQQQEASAADTIATRRRGGRNRDGKAAASPRVAAASGGESSAEESKPTTSARPARTPRKTARMLDAQEPASIRQSSRLRSRGAAS